MAVGAGPLSTSLMRLYRSGAGFELKGLVNIVLKTDKQSLDGDQLTLLYRQFADALSHQSSVTSVSYARMTPLTDMEWN